MRGVNVCDPIGGCGKHYADSVGACPGCGLIETFSDFKPFNVLDWTYDLETYPNIFTAAFKHAATGTRYLFEISERKTQLQELVEFLNALRGTNCRTIGYNNLGFDYPIIHFIMLNAWQGLDVNSLYGRADQIIQTPWNNRYDNVIWDKDQLIKQIDLFKIHHFDNEARRTSLKLLEFNMRSDNIKDLPFPPGVPVPLDGFDTLITYNWHDVDETEKFYIETLEKIQFREMLGAQHQRNFLNSSDKKIGSELFVKELERRRPGCCYLKTLGGRITQQTLRPRIALRDVILPYIQFEQTGFQTMRDWFAGQIITETKGVFVDLSIVVDGFEYVFGVGGIHGSIEPATIHATDEFKIIDIDVTGYYPSLGAVNNLAPEHLGEFGAVDAMLKAERAKHKKGTPLNKAMKLARNGAYGDTNSKYSPFYDPQYMMSITINGQLLLCMLAEQLIKIPRLEMIQINTDGLTVRIPEQYVAHLKTVCKWWEGVTKLDLEFANYSRMFIRDVNNYIAQYTDGKVKRKGAYEYELEWHQDHSELIVPKAAEAALLHGKNITEFVTGHLDLFDFMLRTKIKRSDYLIATDTDGNEQKLQNITRYYISTDGKPFTKVSPPVQGHKVGQWKRANALTDAYYREIIAELNSVDFTWVDGDLDADGLPWDERINTKNQSKYIERRTSIAAGRLCTECNDINQASRDNIDFSYYINQVNKIVDPVGGIK